ncbi:hypothetical protein [Candidatus Competibacter denitrificans]|nr:hypothetical protein [Candidatus Competibacter denitrificans]
MKAARADSPRGLQVIDRADTLQANPEAVKPRAVVIPARRCPVEHW